MTEFYKGKLINAKNLTETTYNLDIVEEKASNRTKSILFKIDTLARKKNYEGNKSDIDNIVIDMIKPVPVNEQGMEIIYQKVYDENGNVYAKELITNVLFPIKNEYSSYDVNYRVGDIRFVYYDLEQDEMFSIKEIMNGNDYCLLGDDLIKEKELPSRLAKKLCFMAPGDERNYYTDGKKSRIAFYLPYSYNIDIKPIMTFGDDKDITYTITNEEKANELEVYDYTEKFEKGLGKKYRIKEYGKFMKNIILCNDLGNYSIVRDHEERDNHTLVKKIK